MYVDTTPFNKSQQKGRMITNKWPHSPKLTTTVLVDTNLEKADTKYYYYYIALIFWKNALSKYCNSILCLPRINTCAKFDT